MLKPQVLRNWRVATYVSVGLIGFHSVFRTEYKLPTDKPHVFSGLQTWYNRQCDKLLLGFDSQDQSKKKSEK